MSFLSFISCGIPASGRLVYRPVYPQAAEETFATPGFLRDVYDYYRRRRRDEEDEPERELERDPPTRRTMREYNERSAILTRAITKLRAESAAIRVESDLLRERLERATTQKALARLEHDLLLKEQAAILAQAEEAALLEEIELNDVMSVAVIALAHVMQ